MKTRDDLDIIALGNMSIDSIKIEGNGSHRVPGGSAAALLTASSACGAKCGIVTKLGRDFPKTWLKDFESRNVDTKGIHKQKTSCRFELKYDSKGNIANFNEIFCADDSLAIKHIPKHYLDAKHFHLSAAHPKNQKRFLNSLTISKKYSKKRNALSLTLWPTYKEEYTPNFIELLKKVRILFCNNYEAAMLASEENIYDAVKTIHKKGPNIIVLTKGSKGSAVYYKDEFYLFPALRTSRLDATGCGDSFAGGFLAEYIKSRDVEKAGWTGAAMASFTISKMGSWFSAVEKKKIQERINRAKEYYEKGQKSKVTLMDFF